MFKNYIKIAWRSLKKQPFFTFLNTFGLAVGMAGGLLISLYIYDEFSFDKMFADADRIYRVNTDIKFGGEETASAEVSAPMAEAILNDISQVEMTTRIRNRGGALIRKSNTVANTKESRIAFADASMFEMFGIELLVGNAKTALKNPNTLVMTRSAAEKHFGINNALNQTLILNNENTYTVTGIIEDLPKNSFLREHTVFMAMAGHEDAQEGEWGSHNYYTYIKLLPTASIEDVNPIIQDMVGKYLIPWVQNIYPGMTEEAFKASGNYLIYSTIPFLDIHLHSNRDIELSANSSMENVYILSFIGIFLIVLASVNFMNLSTAHSLKRAKEVGVRKTLGSNKGDLIKQFLTESGLISFISLLLAIVIALIALPFFNELSGRSTTIPFNNPFFWLILVSATLLLGLISGSYPAFFMSKFMPVKVLKGSGTTGIGGGKVRNSLVIFQFAISVFLIVSTLVVFQQLQFIQSKDVGFAKDQILVVDDVYTLDNKRHTFKEEVEQLSQVKSATLSSFLPTPSSRNNTTFFKDGSPDQEDALNMQTWGVDHDYMSTLNIEIIAGRDFDPQISTDSTAILLNESAIKVLGLSPDEALGIRLSRDAGVENPFFYKVIGVVKNFHFESLRENVGALSLYLGDFSSMLSIKINEADLASAISGIETSWNKIAPGQPFNYFFLDESFNNTYESEQRLGSIFMVFTILSIFIACLGLFGLAAFNAEKRTKEIGVRKVLGATVGQISYRLTMDFLKLVAIGICISLPIGWYAMNKWLEDFSYRIHIGWEIFAVAALLAIVVAVVTVSFQSIKAAIVNPVKSLRSE
ncbi:FtsX-like permease family protein [Kriegella sp. EG-1]|nr:FtsX-like permease family protein [Flavobacteriaceae bacterium EG-1]